MKTTFLLVLFVVATFGCQTSRETFPDDTPRSGIDSEPKPGPNPVSRAPIPTNKLVPTNEKGGSTANRVEIEHARVAPIESSSVSSFEESETDFSQTTTGYDPPPPEIVEEGIGDESELPKTVFGSKGMVQLEDLYKKKQESGLPFTFGAWHWFHLDASGSDDGYGLESLPGTYFWYFRANPEIKLEDDTFEKLGVVAEVRTREDGKFRPFFNDQWWFYEAYAFVDTPVGRFKGGQIWTQFGLPWDGTFWGNTSYFDGFKLDPDYGVGWENTWRDDQDFKFSTVSQFFFHSAKVNGSLFGGGPESFTGAHEKNTGVFRAVPTWKFGESELELGVSAMVGQIDYNRNRGQSDQVLVAGALDLTYRQGPLKLFGEIQHANGVRNPEQFVSLGDSKRTYNLLAGGDYTVGPVTFRTVASFGLHDDPGGWQSLIIPGFFVKLTDYLDFYVEYVNWQVEPNGASRTEFEDGYQFVLNWNF